MVALVDLGHSALTDQGAYLVLTELFTDPGTGYHSLPSSLVTSHPTVLSIKN